jgi:hypothetical protein
VSCADDGAQIVRVLHSIQNDQHLGPGHHVLQLGVWLGGGHGEDALMRGSAGQFVQRGAGLETHRNRGRAAKIDDLLHALAARATRHQQPVDGAAGPQSFQYGMNANQCTHAGPMLARGGMGGVGDWVIW